MATRKKVKSATEKKAEENFPVVAIGGSAGGLEAIRELLKHLNPATGFAYVYIQHLDPTHKSMLSVILSRETKMKVVEAEEHMRIEKNHLYIIPPNKDLSVIDGVLSLDPRIAKPAIHLPINKFFISLAEKHRDLTIGIVLSGNGNDGTAGLKAIREAGGITMVQDKTAKFTGMPESVIAEDVADLELSPSGMAKELEQIAKNAGSVNGLEILVNANGTEDSSLSQILLFLKKSTGADFTQYKINTIKRRIVRRMILHKFETLAQYHRHLLGHSEEAKALTQDLLINVTSFFRDPDLMEFFKKNTLPQIIQNKNSGEPLRIWVAACSTGEEAYSLAMVILEYSEETKTKINFQVFATDLSQHAIDKARHGVYAAASLEKLNAGQIGRFFSRSEDHYRIQKFVRDHCVFAPHNLFKDPPFSRLDLVSCCNLFIYLNSNLQKKIIATFWYSLNQPGYLILGKSESVGASGQLFFQPEKKYKLYAKKPNTGSTAFVDMNYRLPASETMAARRVQNESSKVRIPETMELHTVVDNLIQKHFVPGSVVINQDMEILQFRGSTSLFLEHAPGKATLNLLKVVHPDLVLDLRNIILKAGRTGNAVKKSSVPLKIKESLHFVSIEGFPFKLQDEESLMLVVFQELPGDLKENTKASFSRDTLVKKLKEELQVALEDMRAIVEDQEASKEELQSANEEIISSNEELQSINEELETSKEEVESTNEELLTINAELQTRNEQLAESDEYAEAIFATIREAVILLNHDFSVKMANKAFYAIFKTTVEETVGRSFFDIENHQWDLQAVRDLLNNVLNFNKTFTSFEIEHEFARIGKKILQLNARKIVQKTSHQEMVLIAMEDMTEDRLAEKMTGERESWFRNMAESAPVMIWISTADNGRFFFNNTWREYTGADMKEAGQTDWLKLMHEDDRDEYLKNFRNHAGKQESFESEYRLRNNAQSYRWIIERAKPLYTNDSFSGYIGSCTEIHDKKIHQEELEKMVSQRTSDLQHLNEEFVRSNNELQQFAYVASHDLQEPLRKISAFSDRLQVFKQDLPPEGSLYLQKIENASYRMRTLIEGLLNFALTNNKEPFVTTDLNATLQQVVQNLDMVLTEKSVTLDFDSLPTIAAIPLQIEQLFYNLINNAVKFTCQGRKPWVQIRCRNLSAEETELLRGLKVGVPYILISVTDNGIGFDNEFSEKVFAIFSRLNERHIYPGTGIGLSLCRRIAENHEGRIFANSHVDEGATFHVVLPTVH